MSKALSVDLRVRVLAAVASGLSHRQAGERFGVSAASVSRWRQRERERHAEMILSIATANDRDITLAEIQASLAEKGIRTSIGALWRFFRRHRITLKKSRRTQASRIGRTS
jgi:transposase